MGNRVDRPLTERNKIISRFLNDLYNDKVTVNRSEEEVRDITGAVLELTEKITTILGELSSRFKVSRNELVGSMKEGTSIGEPDEFDIQVLLETLSMNNGVKLVQGCEDRPGYGHIKIIDTDLAELWSDVMEGHELKSTRNQTRYYQNLYSLRDEFYTRLTEAVTSVRHDPAHVVNKDTGHLEIYSSSVEKHGPAFKCSFRWYDKAKRKLYIDIDIVPVIEFSEIDTGKTVKEELNKLLCKHNTVMAVPSVKLSSCTKGLCFKLAFTSAEVELVASLEMHHKKCYMILKYLYNGFKGESKQRYMVYHSYALKTLVLRHAKTCLRQPEEDSTLAECVLELIDTTIECIKSRKVPHWWYNDFELNIRSIFFETQSIYEKKIHPLYARTFNGTVWMKECLESIGYKRSYKYENCHVLQAFKFNYN